MKQILPAIIAILEVVSVIAQGQSPVTGRVVDGRTGKGIKDARVTVEGKKRETRTNVLGFFQLAADSTQYLVIQHGEYETGKIKVPAAGRFLVKLNPDLAAGYEGGMEEFYRLFARELRYPAEARRMGFEGMIYLSFEVDSLKGIQNIVNLHDLSNRLRVADDVANALQKVPNKWIPKTRTCTMILPVKFKLDSDEPRPEEFTIPPGKLLKEIIVTTRGGLAR